MSDLLLLQGALLLVLPELLLEPSLQVDEGAVLNGELSGLSTEEEMRRTKGTT